MLAKVLHLLAASLPALLPILWLKKSPQLSTNQWNKEYDYVVVGGGSAGCVLAARLSEQRDRTVLLLEAGGSESLVTDFPIAALNLQNTPLDWGYRTEVQEMACFGLKGRRCPWPRGKVLGGCSTLNYMMYIRGKELINSYLKLVSRLNV